MRTSKMMQVFSKQAPMMDALISHFVEQMRRRKIGDNGQPLENVAEGKFQNAGFESKPSTSSTESSIFVSRTKSNPAQWHWRIE